MEREKQHLLLLLIPASVLIGGILLGIHEHNELSGALQSMDLDAVHSLLSRKTFSQYLVVSGAAGVCAVSAWIHMSRWGDALHGNSLRIAARIAIWVPAPVAALCLALYAADVIPSITGITIITAMLIYSSMVNAFLARARIRMRSESAAGIQ
ncbi:MAG: hypothetical protein LBU30_02440 [Candidatus Methanoplasma sp.]|jgi:hypothetical protein|nr:hypothetical protein [Candidatus Methanoplasma sp.]